MTKTATAMRWISIVGNRKFLNFFYKMFDLQNFSHLNSDQLSICLQEYCTQCWCKCKYYSNDSKLIWNRKVDNQQNLKREWLLKVDKHTNKKNVSLVNISHLQWHHIKLEKHFPMPVSSMFIILSEHFFVFKLNEKNYVRICRIWKLSKMVDLPINLSTCMYLNSYLQVTGILYYML